jgi:hypothetical protein
MTLRRRGSRVGAVGIEVEEGEEVHFAAGQDRGDAVVDIVVRHLGGWFDGAGGVEDNEDDLGRCISKES